MEKFEATGLPPLRGDASSRQRRSPERAGSWLVLVASSLPFISGCPGQLDELAERLSRAPAGPTTERAFFIGAELSKVVASMSWK